MTIHLDAEPIKTVYDQLLHVENDVYLSVTPISVYQSDEDGSTTYESALSIGTTLVGSRSGTKLLQGGAVIDSSAADLNTIEGYATRDIAWRDGAGGGNLPKSIYGWSHDLVFTATDHNTIAWTGGSIKMADATTYSIDAGNLDMSAVTYIYFDADISATVLQSTTTVGSSVGEGRFVICVVKNNAVTTADCTFQVFGGLGLGVFITADVIGANVIVANHISANTITTNELNFTPVQHNDVIARINASAEGLYITADRIQITGSTTFAANYDPSDKIQVFTSQPTTPYYIGDIWTDGTDIKYCSNARASGAFVSGDWTLAADWTNDDTADQAISDAATSQAAADGKIVTFFQAGVPTAEGSGDLWFNTGAKNLVYRATNAGDDEVTAGEWEIARDTDIAQAISDASDAQTRADEKVVTFFQDGIPTSEGIGDLWIDTNDNNKLYRAASAGADQITAGEWVLAQDDTFDQNYIIRSDSQPSTRPDGSSLKEGDIWIDTNAGNAEYTYTGASFVRNQTQIDGGYITTGTVNANRITAMSPGGSTQRIEINADGNNRLNFYDSGNNQIIRIGENLIGTTDGIKFTGNCMAFWYTSNTTAVSQIHCVKFSQNSVTGIQGLQTLYLAHGATNPTVNPTNSWVVSKVEGIRNSSNPIYGIHTRTTNVGTGPVVGHKIITIAAAGTTSGINMTTYGTGIVYGVLSTTTGIGAFSYGIFGEATGAASTNFGVFGSASGGGTNWGGYFTGNFNLASIPTSNPGVSGSVFRTGNDLRISTG